MANEITKEDVVKFIEGMTVLELSELVKELEQKFGVSAAAPVFVRLVGPAMEPGPAHSRSTASLCTRTDAGRTVSARWTSGAAAAASSKTT